MHPIEWIALCLSTAGLGYLITRQLLYMESYKCFREQYFKKRGLK